MVCAACLCRAPLAVNGVNANGESICKDPAEPWRGSPSQARRPVVTPPNYAMMADRVAALAEGPNPANNFASARHRSAFDAVKNGRDRRLREE